MNSKRMYFALNGIVVLLVATLIGGAYGVDQVLQNQSKNLVDQRTQLQALELESNTLVRSKREVAQYQPLSSIASSIVPQDKDQAQTVREIVKIAANNEISLGSISFPASNLGTTTAGTSSTKSATTSSSSTLALSQLKPVAGINGVYNLEITVQSDTNKPVTYSKFIGFLDGLEHNRRTALVSNIALTPDAKDSTKISFSLTLDEYIKP